MYMSTCKNRFLIKKDNAPKKLITRKNLPPILHTARCNHREKIAESAPAAVLRL